jgi:hypothetical protein
LYFNATTITILILREEARIMKKEKKAFKGWVDPMATPYHYKKG